MGSASEELQIAAGNLQHRNGVLQLTPAQTLEQIARTLSPEPLENAEELRAFYRPDLNAIRGIDIVGEMKFALQNSFGAIPYKAFLMGHSGVGKPTEISRLLREVEASFRPIRFSVKDDLTPTTFKPTDVPLLMMILIIEKTRAVTGHTPSQSTMQRFMDWFAKETGTRTEQTHTEITGEAGIGPSAESWLGKMLGLVASIKGQLKYSADRKKEVVEYRLSRLSDLLSLANQLISECNALLMAQEQREWLFVGEDFDKGYIPTALVEDLFINYGSILQQLNTHLLFDLPLALYYSSKSASLPRLKDGRNILPDTPVFHPDHRPHREGRAALQSVMEARVHLDLFEKGQLMRLIVASGGNLRDLFHLVTQAALKAMVQTPPKTTIGKAEADKAINALRTEYLGRLGEGPYEANPIPYSEKAERLVTIYHQKPDADVRDKVLHALLNASVVQEFNGEHWLGVHPLVVDILNKQGRLSGEGGKPAPGGTR